MPEQDHIAATQKVKISGMLKRMKDMWDAYRFHDEIHSNVFAPTSTLKMFSHLAKLIPNHQLILADFDCFWEPMKKDSIKGLNAPLVSHKMCIPTEVEIFNTLMIERGQADIYFPSDF